MDLYNTVGLAREIRYKIHDESNLVLLRKDLHQTLFDHRYWVFVPRCGKPTVCFIKNANESFELYHGRQTYPLYVNAAYLYSRFAWAVLPQAQTAAKQGALKVKVWDSSANSWTDGEESATKFTKRNATEPAGPVSTKLSKPNHNPNATTPNK